MGARSNRIEFVDFLRGLAVAGMFFVHSAVAWLRPEYVGTPFWRFVSAVSGHIAPTFLFLAGVSISLVAARADGAQRRRQIARRGLRIWALGYALHFAFFALGGFHGGVSRLIKVDILHCIGFSLAVLPWLAWPRSRFNWRALVAFAVLILLGQLFTVGAVHELLPVSVSSYFSTAPRLALFPPFPYAAWVALGLFVGPLWQASIGDNPREWRIYVVLGLLAAGLLLGARLTKDFYYSVWLGDWQLMRLAPRGLVHFFLQKAAVVVALFTLGGLLEPLIARARLKPALDFGRDSLFAYGIHLFFVYHIGGSLLIRRLGPVEQTVGFAALAVLMWALVVTRRLPRVQSWTARLAPGLLIQNLWNQSARFFGKSTHAMHD